MEKRGNYLSKLNSSQGFEKIKEILSRDGASVHFLGVGGISMYSLFNFTRLMGIRVSGSDKILSERTEKLIKSGFDVKVPENPDGAMRASLLVYSLAVAENDRELRIAEELGILEVSRAEYLGYLAELYKTRVSVSGSHGKSTVTAMLTKILSDAGLSPSSLSGARLSETAEPYVFGDKEYLVFEACEYKDSFLKFTPDIAVFLNLELDHTDYFKSFDDISRSFLSAMKRAGRIAVNRDDAELYALAERSGVPFLSYGIEDAADIRAVNLKKGTDGYSFSVEARGFTVADISLSVLGSFSVYNALAAFSAAYSLGISPPVIAKSLSSFHGIERRLELLYKRKCGAPVIYDYAHHPSEIKAGISAIKDCYSGKINVIFKPHTYTRTRDLFDEFVISLGLADRVFLSEIDAIRENKIEGVTSGSLARSIGDNAFALSDEEILEKIKELDGAVLIMGAANLEDLKEKILKEKI